MSQRLKVLEGALETARSDAQAAAKKAGAELAANETALKALKKQEAEATKARTTLELKVGQLEAALKSEKGGQGALGQKLAQAEAALQAQQDERASLEQRMSELESALVAEQTHRASLQRELEQARATPAAPAAGGGASAEVIAERDKLKADIAGMKKKLMAAESAIEAAATYKAKLARLEAQLKGGKK
jgi:chromosome segregation ATPase